MTAEQREQFMREAIALSIENVRTGRGGPFGLGDRQGRHGDRARGKLRDRT